MAELLGSSFPITAVPRRVLVLLCCFTALAGCWLGMMDVLLKHTHLVVHEAIAGTIVVQGLLTLAALHYQRMPYLRPFAMAGCGVLLFLAYKALHGLMTSPDFEGYIALLGLCLALQAALTFVALRRSTLLPPPRSSEEISKYL